MKSVKTKTKPKLSEEEKREQIRSGKYLKLNFWLVNSKILISDWLTALLKKKSFEEKALHLVESLMQTGLKPDFLIESAQFLNQSFYSDAVEERSLTGKYSTLIGWHNTMLISDWLFRCVWVSSVWQHENISQIQGKIPHLAEG